MKAPAEIVYFGKLPARGDFLRSGDNEGLTDRLDRWLTHGLELMARDARWKETYDQAAPASFAFLGVRSRAVVAGHLLASRDASGRRFPFVAAGRAEVDAPLPFMQCAPLALQPLWQHLHQACAAALDAADVVGPLNTLCQTALAVEADPRALRTPQVQFLELQTIGSLQAQLREADPGVDLRRTLLALGLLLQPVPGSGASRLDKGVRLPLPAEPQQQSAVAALWLDLSARFLQRGDFEVAVFVPRAASACPPSLALGFSGDSPALLQAVLDPAAGQELFLDLSAPEWVEDAAGHDQAVRKLSSYLQQPQLSLAQARATFNEAFLGE